MSDVDKTLQSQRDEIARLRESVAELRGALNESRRLARPKNESTFSLPDGTILAYLDYVEIDAVFTMTIRHGGRYTLHDKAPGELGVACVEDEGLVLKKPLTDGRGSSTALVVQRIACETPGVVLRIGWRVKEPPQVFSGRRLIDADPLAAPIQVPYAMPFRITADVPENATPVDLIVIISGLRRIF